MTDTIAALLPHSGPMVLVDSIIHWDKSHIRCRAHSHRREDNPLRQDGVISVFAGVEYAAQAMAAHARLVGAQQGAAPRRGFVAVASRLAAGAQRLDAEAQPLDIDVTVVASSGDSSLYQFTLHAGERQLLSGQLTAIIAPEDAPSP